MLHPQEGNIAQVFSFDNANFGRDLACRNLLVTDSNAIKISDFGMSMELEGEYYKTAEKGGGCFPVRWYVAN